MTNDPILEAVIRGDRTAAVRLIAEIGVWVAFRDPEYFDTEDCLPVFSSPEHIPNYLETRGIKNDPDREVTAQLLGPVLFQFSPHHRSQTVLNPDSDGEMKLTEEEFDLIESFTDRAPNDPATATTLG